MDEIFDKVKEHAGRAKDEAAKLTRQVVDKTNSLITQTKLNFAVSETESKIKDIYTEMGKTVYEKYAEEGSVCECMQDSCAKVDELKAEAADLRAKLAELKETVRCETCGEYNKKTASYCSKCGARLSEEKSDSVYEEDEDDQVITIKSKKPETAENEDEE